MKQLLLSFLVTVILLLGGGTTSKAQTTLAAGDIAIVLINATDNTLNSVTLNDNVSFVLLKDIASGTKIYFTDFGWRSDAPAFQSAVPCGASTGAVSDGIVEWTATSALPYGTVVHMNVKFTPTVNIGTITGYQATYNVATQYVSIAVSSEAIFAYQGSISSPTLITGVNTKNAWATTLLNCDFNPTFSTLPSALTTGSSALSWSTTSVNGILNSSVTLTGNKATDLANIYNPANWTYNASVAFPITSVTLSPPATLPTVTTNAATSVNSTGATLNGSVNANNASTTVTFEYGLTTGYGSSTTADQSPVTGSSATSVSKAITGLSASTTYHYRVKGVNAGGTSNGSDQTFATSAAGPTISSFTPTSACPGTTITITGTNFTGATAVSFGGTAANSFSVVNTTTITAVVASGSSGSVSVTTAGGTGTKTVRQFDELEGTGRPDDDLFGKT